MRSARRHSRGSRAGGAAAGGRARPLPSSQPALRDVGDVHPERRARQPWPASSPRRSSPAGAPRRGWPARHRRAAPPAREDVATVEDPDRHEVDRVEEEARVGQREPESPVGWPGYTRQASAPAHRRSGPAIETRALRHGSNALIAQRDVRAEERDEDGQLRVRAPGASPRRSARLMDEDQQHEADREAPAPDQRVPADRDEDPEELEGARELEQQPPGRRSATTAAQSPGGRGLGRGLAGKLLEVAHASRVQPLPGVSARYAGLRPTRNWARNVAHHRSLIDLPRAEAPAPSGPSQGSRQTSTPLVVSAFSFLGRELIDRLRRVVLARPQRRSTGSSG